MSRELKAVEAKATIGISASAEATIFRTPTRYLSESLVEGKLIEGLVVSVIFLQYFSAKKLEGYFKSKSIPVKPLELGNLSVKRITILLEGFGLISQEIHSLMGEVVNERNKVVHQLTNPEQIDKDKPRKQLKRQLNA